MVRVPAKPESIYIPRCDLVAVARKWRELAKRRSAVAEKGHFVVYSTDKQRFVVPLVCLSSHAFKELLRMAEEEFGLPADGPIMLPCDGSTLEYVLAVLRGRASAEVEKAAVAAVAPVATGQCYAQLSLASAVNDIH
ncbi:hypothetical protein NMG60_11024520 [Bertholletia excelsa]